VGRRVEHEGEPGLVFVGGQKATFSAQQPLQIPRLP
jgi:hypothetical protein